MNLDLDRVWEKVVERSSREAFNEIAWRDFILFAYQHEPIVSQFERETGRTITAPPSSALEAMIDRATGKTDADLNAFVLWATEHHWGIDEAPEKVRAAILARKV